jgi:hypothetical protein
MAIFEDELITNNPVEGDPIPQLALGTPQLSAMPTLPNLGGGGSANKSIEGLDGSQLSKIAKLPGQGGGANLIPLSEVVANKRYNTYVRGMDLENIYGMQQSAWSQLGNSVVKMAGLGVGTFVQGFATIPNTISALKNGKFADLSGGPDSYEAAIDDWTKNLEDYFPNYYTRKEKESPFLAMVPFMPGSANFWGDKIIKNLGFTAGAIGSALVQDAIVGAVTEGVGAAPLLASQLGKASLWLNKLYAGSTKVDRVLDLASAVGKTEKQILNIKRLGEIAAGTKVTNGFRYATGIYGSSRTEAAIEARDSYRQVKDELIKEYKSQNPGKEPFGADLAEIESYATDAMNTRFGINMALLTASNTIQFGNLFKSFTSAQKGLSGELTRHLEDAGKIGLQKGSLDVFEKKTAETIGGRVWDSVRPKIDNILAEGVYEEGGQYAAEKGTYDYFTRKYRNLSNPLYKDNWNTTVEAVDSTVKGFKDQFGTSEGLENMIVGAISAMISGGIMGRIDKAKGGGADARLTKTIATLNQYGLTGILSNQFDNTLTSAGIAAEMDQAAKSGDVFKYKNLKDDLFFDYVSSRLPSGMHDVTIEQLNMLKDLDKEEFEKTFGMDFNSSNKSTVSEYVGALVDQANDIKKTYDSIDATFKNPFNASSDTINYNIFNGWKKELAYNASKIPSIQERLDSIQQSVSEINPQVTNAMLSQLTNKESLRDLSKSYEERASQLNKTITEFTTPADSKRIKDQVKALRTASEKINLGLSSTVDTKLFDYLLNFELNNQSPTDAKIVGPEWSVDLFNYGHDINRHNELKVKVSKLFDNLASESGFNKYFKQAEEMQAEVVTPTPPTIEEPTPVGVVTPTFKNKSGEQEPIQVNREYQIPASKKARVDKIADDRFQVTSPDGNITFYPSKEKADAIAADLNEEFGNLQKVKVVGINPDGTVKVEDINGDIYDIEASRFEGYERIQTEQEKLQKFSEDIDKSQKEIESKSGTVSTSPSPIDLNAIVKEDPKKSITNLFSSTTSISENDPANLKAHEIRSIELKNNARSFPNRQALRIILVTQNQEKSLGLDGLANLSMGSVGIHTDVDNGLVVAVYVEQDKNDVYFINEKGERIGKLNEPVDINKVVFDSMPTTSITNRFNKEPRYRATDGKEAAEEQSARWKEKRKQLFDNKGKPESYKFTISRGIADVIDLYARNPVGKTMIDESLIATQEGLVVISTTGTISHQGEDIKFPVGRPVFQYGDVLQFLSNKMFNKEEAETIFEVMNLMSKSINNQLAAGRKVKIDSDYATFLQNLLYWRKSSDTSANQIFVDIETMDLFFNGERYDLTNIEASKADIVGRLQKVYNSVNNTTLTKSFSEPFTEYYLKDGTLETREWDNYQSYLLSSKNPDGSARSSNNIPLASSVREKNDLKPYNFKSKYSILEGMELPQVVVKPAVVAVAPIVTPVTPAAAPAISDEQKVIDFIGKRIQLSLPEGTIGDGSPQTYKGLNAGEVVYTITPEGQVAIDGTNPTNLATIKTVVNTPASMAAINAALAPAPAAEAIVTPPAPGQKKTFGKAKPSSNSDYMKVARVGEENDRKLNDLELQLLKEWHAENVPNIPYEILENLVNINDTERAYGVYEDGVAKFYKGGLSAAPYHELFHPIWQDFLSQDERQAIMDEFKAKKGSFTERSTGNKIDYNEATDKQIEERIADDFGEFRVGKLPARSLSEKVLSFFRAIIEFVKQFVQKPSKKTELFKAIDAGKYKEKKVSETPVGTVVNPSYKQIGALTEQQAYEFVQDITARWFQIVFGTNRSLYDIENLAMTDIFEDIKEDYVNRELLDDNDPDALSTSEFDQLITRTKEFLRTFKIEFTEDDNISINDESRDKNEYTKEAFTTNWKSNSPFAIKLLMGTMTETSSSNGENENLDMPKLKTNSFGGYKLLDFSRAFATAIDKFSNTTKATDLVNKLVDLAVSDNNYVRLFTRLGGSRKAKTIDFSQFKSHDWRLFINFYQTFTRQKPDAIIQYITDENVYSGPANLFTSIKEVKRSWIENMRALAKDPESLLSYNGDTGTLQAKDIKKLPIRSTQDKIDFLGKLGIIFPIEAYGRLKTKEQDNQVKQFGDAVSAIRTFLGSEADIMTISGKTLTIDAQLSTLAELLIKVTNPNQDTSFFGLDKKRIQAYTDNNAVSVFENLFNSAATLDDLMMNVRPELQDVFSANSVVLKKGGLFFDKNGKRIRKLKVQYIQGTKNAVNNKEIVTSKLSEGDRFVQEMNQNINGSYYVLVPADSSTEWMMNLGNSIKFSDIQSGKATSKIYDTFIGYLKDDIAIARENRTNLRNVQPRAKELRFFKDILPKDVLQKLNDLIAVQDATDNDFKVFIENNIDKIHTSIDSYIEFINKNTIDILKNNNQIIVSDIDKKGNIKYSFKNLDDDFSKKEGFNKRNLDEFEINDIIKFTNVNYVINNIELHKIMFGDPYQFAIKDGQLDETKRIKSFLSPRRTTFDSAEYNTFLNQQYNKVGDVQLTAKDPGYHLYKSYTKTVTLNDTNIVGSVAMLKNIPEEIQKKYRKEAKETDGFSWIMDNTYKEVKLKNGQWSDEAELWHQWQMAYTRQNTPGYEYTSEALKKQDAELVSKPAPKYVTEVLKPIVTGNRNNLNKIELVLDKFSQMPIYYSMVEGTNLEKQYIKMFNDKVGYAVVLSGRKVGAGKVHNIYNADGSFNNDAYTDDMIVDVPWSSYGIQVENSYEGPKEQTRGSQITKLASIDLFNNGEGSEAAVKEYAENKKWLNLMNDNAYKSLLKKLGIEDLGDSFKLVDNIAVSETLEYEMLRREMSTNAKDTVQLDENKQFRIPFEASTAYVQIRDILFSMVDKALLSPKVNGGAHVQVPVTMFENLGNRQLAYNSPEGWTKINTVEYNKLSDVEKKKVVLTDTTLKFYTREEPYCEVLLPHWFGEKFKSKFKTEKELIAYLNKPENASILTGIGFRIPTQSLSSIEVFKVKGFLPKSMGATVVVPSEIVTKAGSDFDIDKLNMYLKATYIDKNGDLRLVDYKGSEEATLDFYSQVFDDVLAGKKLKKAELFAAVDILTYSLDDPNNLIGKYGSLIDVMLEEYQQSEDLAADLMKDLEKLGDESIQSDLRNKFAANMYKKSLENQYYMSLERLVTLPENFNRLISPVDDAGLKDASTKLDKLRGVDESVIPNRILDRNYMTRLRHSFIVAKKWVGIAAVNITGHSLAQRAGTYIDPERFVYMPALDKVLLGDGYIALPHNTTKDGYVSIGGRKTADGKQYISDRLSGYATSFVDVAKDPYIMKIIKSDLVVGTFMFLERIGAGETAVLFMNQPIIVDYLNELESSGSKNLFSKGKILDIIDKYGGSGIDPNPKFDVNNLEKNISSKEVNEEEQVAIFSEFLKYAKMAEYSFKLTQAVNYDTSKMRSSGSLYRKQLRTEEANRSNIFSSAEKILDASFIGDQSQFLNKSFEGIGEILKFDNYKFRNVINRILKPYAKDDFLSADNYSRIENKVVASFLDYIVQTKSGISSEIGKLMLDDATSVVTRLAEIKAKYSDIAILNKLDIQSSPAMEGGAKTVKLTVNNKEAYDEDVNIGMFRELRDYNSETNSLYKDIVKLAILQGTYQSALSIKNVIPIEDYSAIVAPIIAPLIVDADVQAFADGYFQRNNFKDSEIWKTIHPKFFIARAIGEDVEDVMPVSEDQYGNPIYQYLATYAFPNIKELKIKSSERKILVLNETFNYLDVQEDFVIVPRVVVDGKTGVKVDMVTGRTVTDSMLSATRKKGNPIYKSVYGYQKVKHLDGTPVTFTSTYKGEDMVNHVYKLINLYGDNPLTTEYYTDFKPSVLNNNTMKVSSELPDVDIIDYFAPQIKEEMLKSIPQEVLPTEEAPAVVSGKKELFSFEKGITQKSFRGKPLEFLDNIPTQKETVVAMRNNRQTGVISIDQKAMVEKFNDKAWTKPAKQLDGSFATALTENEFNSPEEWFTFALIHEVKHDTIFKEEGETTGQYEDRINQAALEDLRSNYSETQVRGEFPDKQLNIKDEKCK